MMSLIRNADNVPKWLGDTGRFWYRKQTANGSQIVAVDTTTGSRQPAFDHAAVAAALNRALTPEVPLSADALDLQNLQLTPDGRTLTDRKSTRLNSSH